MNRKLPISLALAALALSACVSVPSGPSVMALPGNNKSFDQFRLDEMECRQYAHLQIGGADVNQAAIDSGVTSAALGALVGAAAGAAIGGDSRGAATGAGIGLLGGAAVGNDAGRYTGSELQRRYDNGFIQCMYAKGHKVPLNGQFVDRPAGGGGYAPPPPPPPGPR